MPSVRFKKADSSRLDQCDNPVPRGGLQRVTATIRARTSAGTRSGWTTATGLSSNPATPSAANRLRALPDLECEGSAVQQGPNAIVDQVAEAESVAAQSFEA